MCFPLPPKIRPEVPDVTNFIPFIEKFWNTIKISFPNEERFRNVKYRRQQSMEPRAVSVICVLWKAASTMV